MQTLPDNARVTFSSRLGWMIYFEQNGIPFCEGPFGNEHKASDFLTAHRASGKIEGSFGPRRRAWGRSINR